MLPFNLEEYLKENYKPEATGGNFLGVLSAVGYVTKPLGGLVDINLPSKIVKGLKKTVSNYDRVRTSAGDPNDRNRMKNLNCFIDDVIERKGFSGLPEVYKNSLIAKSAFLKMYNSPDASPQKETALALCIGMKLTLEEANDFLGILGYSFSERKLQDLIVKCFVENEYYDIYKLNLSLEEWHQGPVPKHRFMKEKVAN